MQVGEGAFAAGLGSVWVFHDERCVWVVGVSRCCPAQIKPVRALRMKYFVPLAAIGSAYFIE
jgi:hypothetical protein